MMRENLTLSGLNEGQAHAVEYTSGPLLVLAGPGSGKTLTITRKIEYLSEEEGLPAEKILALTFSEKAAGEMQDRLEKRTGTGATVSTFHSFCNDLIREFALYLGISPSCRLISKEHACVWGIRHIDSFAFEYLPLPGKPESLVSSLLEGVSQYHDELIGPEELERYVEEKRLFAKKSGKKLKASELDKLNKQSDLARFYGHYEHYKRANDFMDFDDMISLACSLLEKHEAVREEVQSRYAYVLVDEFQDTNFAQLYLLRLLAPDGKLTCVADDDQCIYRFRGAYLSNISQLETYYPTLRKIPLELNYRATSQLVDTALRLISCNPTRQEKTLLSHKGEGKPVKVVRAPDELSEAEWVAEEIERLIREKGVSPGKIFVLTRKRKDGKKFSEALARRLIPTEYVGSLRLSHFPLIRQALAYMHVVANPFGNGPGFTKVLAREGVNEHNLQKINTAARRLRAEKTPKIPEGAGTNPAGNGTNTERAEIPPEGDGVYTVLSYCLEEMGLSQESLVRSVLSRINELLDYKKHHLPSDTLKYLLNEKTDLYRAQLARDSAGARRNIALLKNLVTMVEDLENLDGKSDFEGVIEALDLVFRLELEQEVEGDAETVKIMTIHQSKGREAEAVFLCDLAERHLPIDYRQKQFTVPPELSKGNRSPAPEKLLHLEEERRLAYVGMTRAEKALYLVFPERYRGNRRPSNPSQFLKEIGFRDSPKIEFIEADQAAPLAALEPESPLKKKMGEYERLVAMYSRQKQFKEAMEALLDLACLREFEEKGSLTAFDPRSFLKVDPGSPEELEALVREDLPPLLNKNFAFSASGIKDYLACPLRFKYGSVLRIPTPRKSRPEVGIGVHALFEELARRQKSGEETEGGAPWPRGSKALTLLLEEFRKNSVFASKTEETRTLAKVRAMLDYWLRFEEDNPNEILEVESSFEFEMGTHRFAGKLDRLDITPSGEYVLLDYKSGKSSLSRKELEEDLQLALYCEAVRKKYGKLPARAGHMYVHPDLEKVVVFPVDPAKVEKVLKRIQGTADEISEEKFEPGARPDCYYCDYKSICEHYNNS